MSKLIKVDHVVSQLSDKISELSNARGYPNSYPYQYGYFVGRMASLLSEILTEEQIAQLEERIAAS